MKSDSKHSDIKNKIREWWDDPSQDYDGFIGHGVNSEIEKELWGNEIAQLLGHRQNLKILDIGTGTGFLALLLAGMGYGITAVDWSMTMMQKAKEKAASAQIPIQFEVQDAENLTFPDASFDAVVSRHVLWTLADPVRASREWARVIKPGGMVITDIPHQGSHSGKHHYGDEIGKQLPLGNGADPEEIISMFEEAGLSNINLRLLEKEGEQHRKTLLIHGEKI
jgi:ubiquinone/menaquinone biosynthesis C-methylase UbiE